MPRWTIVLCVRVCVWGSTGELGDPVCGLSSPIRYAVATWGNSFSIRRSKLAKKKEVFLRLWRFYGRVQCWKRGRYHRIRPWNAAARASINLHNCAAFSISHPNLSPLSLSLHPTLLQLRVGIITHRILHVLTPFRARNVAKPIS